MLRCAGTSFQSPLHRGSLWNKEVRDVMVSEGTLSVPSSSGKSLEQSVRRMQSFGSFFFQSPLHRGSLWNKPTSKPRYTFHFSFSPLFIGEVSGTHELGRVNARLDAFQSPLHRGSLWNRGTPRCRALRRLPFSPLFIGEVSGTQFEFVHLFRLCSFQSPLHRGSLCNT